MRENGEEMDDDEEEQGELLVDQDYNEQNKNKNRL
jgi:hypothetical protein